MLNDQNKSCDRQNEINFVTLATNEKYLEINTHSESLDSKNSDCIDQVTPE